MDINTQPAPPFFLQGFYDNATKKEVMGSRLWPIIVAAINQVKDSHDSLVVGDVIRFENDNKHIMGVSLTNRVGFNVVGMYMASEDPKADIYFGGINSSNRNQSTLCIVSMHPSVKSSNVKYIVRKIKTPNTDPSIDLANKWTEAKNYVNTKLERMLDSGLTAGNSDRIDRILLNKDAVIALVKMHMGDMSRTEVPQDVLAHIELRYLTYVDTQKKVRDYATDIRQMFSNDKWVLFSNMYNNSVIVGAVSKQPFQAAVDNYISTGSLPSTSVFKYAEIVVPFKWYKSFTDIDDDIRRDIEMQLTMLKLHTKSDKPIIPTAGSIDTASSIERGYSVYPDIGAMTQSHYYESPIIVMDKTV